MLYTDKAIDHFMNPRNVGEICNADGVGTIGSEECGDMVKVWIKVDDLHLVDIKYKVFGCPAAIAVCSMMTELAMGMHVDDAYEITDAQVAQALGGLPDQKYHCSNLAASALHKAILSYVLKKPTKANDVTITVLVNNTASTGLQCEHGLSIWIEYADKRILFDTGQTDVIQKNAEHIGVDLADIDAVVLSHGHYDHTGGIPSVINSAAKATLYLHPKATEQKYSQKPGKVNVVGMSKQAKEIVQYLEDKGRIIRTELPTEVYPNLFITGPIPRNTSFEDTGGNFYTDQNCHEADELTDDQAVYFETEKGLVVLLGCAHAGVVNTLEYIIYLTGEKRLYAVIGGMHLKNASLARIEETIIALRKYNIQKLIPLHCTGQDAIEKLKHEFGDRVSTNIPGNKMKL